MKKKGILAGIILLLAASVCVIAVAIRKNRESNPVRIDDKSSFFEDFTVQDDVVNIKCKLCLQNISGQDKKFYIRAKSPEDVGVLLSDENLIVREMGAEKLFECKAGERIVVDVTFVGQYGGTEQKADREIPDEIALVYTEGISTESIVITDEIGFLPALDAEEKDLKMWQQIGERLEETLSDLEGVDDADIEIDRQGDALKVDVGIAYSDSAQDAEALQKNIEKTVAQFFPDGTILSFYEKAESSETESDETQSNRAKPWYGAYQSILYS